MNPNDTAARTMLKDEIEFSLSAKRGGGFVLTDSSDREIGAGPTGADAILAALAGASRQAKQNRVYLALALALATDVTTALDFARDFVDDNDEGDEDEEGEGDEDGLQVERE